MVIWSNKEGDDDATVWTCGPDRVHLLLAGTGTAAARTGTLMPAARHDRAG
jgi:hypothetical protein